MSQTETIRVELADRSYDIVVRDGGLINELHEYSETLDAEQAIVVTDNNVAELYLNGVIQELSSKISRVDEIIVPAGEASKSVQQVESLWKEFLRRGADRETRVIALGGGVIGDLAGFAAASFARGLPFIQFPTSLLAQVDSSVGGKTGINLADAKNMVGAFWQPNFVLIDPATLSSLDQANYTAGLAEVVKYGVIMDGSFFSTLEESVEEINNRDFTTLTSMIADCCRLKAKVVAEDETEVTGRRAILNYGHTFGHAIESVFGYGNYLHGHAVSIGMQCAAWLAHHLGIFGADSVRRQTELLGALGCNITLEPGKESELVAAMHRDKKVQRGKLRLVLPTEIGNVELVDAPDDALLRQAFEKNST